MYVKIIENALNELNKKIPGTTTNVERLEMVLAMMSSRTMVGRDKNKLPFTIKIKNTIQHLDTMYLIDAFKGGDKDTINHIKDTVHPNLMNAINELAPNSLRDGNIFYAEIEISPWMQKEVSSQFAMNDFKPGFAVLVNHPSVFVLKAKNNSCSDLSFDEACTLGGEILFYIRNRYFAGDNQKFSILASFLAPSDVKNIVIPEKCSISINDDKNDNDNYDEDGDNSDYIYGGYHPLTEEDIRKQYDDFTMKIFAGAIEEYGKNHR